MFFLEYLSKFHENHGVDAISVTTHGASAVLLDAGGGGDLAAPMLDYEYDGPDSLTAEYDAIRPAFAETASPPHPHMVTPEQSDALTLYAAAWQAKLEEAATCAWPTVTTSTISNAWPNAAFPVGSSTASTAAPMTR